MAVLEMEIGSGFNHVKEVSIDLKTGNTAITLLPADDNLPGEGIELSPKECRRLIEALSMAEGAMARRSPAEDDGNGIFLPRHAAPQRPGMSSPSAPAQPLSPGQPDVQGWR